MEAVIYSKARASAQFTNDAFGGQNWEGITQSITNPAYKKLAQTTFKPASRGYLQLLFFACRQERKSASTFFSFAILPI